MSLYLSIQAHVRPPELHRSLFVNDKFFWFPKGSLLPTDSLSYRISDELLSQTTRTIDQDLNKTATSKGSKTAGSARPATQETARKATEGPPPMRLAVTESLLEALLNDVLGDDDVINAFSQLDKPPAPCYVQLIKDPPAPFVHKEEAQQPAQEDPATRDEEEAAEMDEETRKLQPEFAGGGRGAQVAVIESPRDNRGATARGATAREADLVMRQTPPTATLKNGWMVLAGCHVPGHSAMVPLEMSIEEKEAELLAQRRRQVMRLPEFENFAHFVLDACMFNLLEEATFGEDSVVDPDLVLCKHPLQEHWVEKNELCPPDKQGRILCPDCAKMF